MSNFNNQIKQLLILSLLIGMVILALRELRGFLPGLLGALTLYILSRGRYYQLVYHRKWKKSLTAILFLLFYVVILSSIVYITIALLEPRVEKFFADPAILMDNVKKAFAEIEKKAGFSIFTDDTISNFLKRLSDFIPALINNTADLLTNFILLLFLLYYMLVHGKEMEQYLSSIVPFSQGNIHILVAETKRLVKASAIGIPLISLIQGLTATLGYYFFDVKEFALWGFLTGVFAFFPLVGTMLVWVPLVIFMYASGDSWNATWLFFYSLIITGNVDYLARITLLDKLGHMHPVVTVLGVIVGLSLFGFIGFIFGPLLISYIILLFRIYTNEFLQNKNLT